MPAVFHFLPLAILNFFKFCFYWPGNCHRALQCIKFNQIRSNFTEMIDVAIWWLSCDAQTTL